MQLKFTAVDYIVCIDFCADNRLNISPKHVREGWESPTPWERISLILSSSPHNLSSVLTPVRKYTYSEKVTNMVAQREHLVLYCPEAFPSSFSKPDLLLFAQS